LIFHRFSYAPTPILPLLFTAAFHADADNAVCYDIDAPRVSYQRYFADAFRFLLIIVL